MISQNILSDEFLIKKLKEGDKEAFEIIYEKYYMIAYRIFMNNFFNVQISEDATHDLFLKLRDKIKNFDGIKCFKAWFIVVVRRFAYDILRLSKKNKVNKSLNIFCDKDGECFLDNFCYSSSSDIELIEREELIEKIKKAFSKVPHVHQQMLDLYYLNDLSLKEIATKINLPLGTVKSRIARALIHFKSACDDTEGLLECL